MQSSAVDQFLIKQARYRSQERVSMKADTAVCALPHEEQTISITPSRRWLTIKQFAAEHPGFTEPAIRALYQRIHPHFNSRGEWVEGNGLAGAFCQPGGRNGRILIDEIAFERWLETWVVDSRQNEMAA
jgi:hypothetical protein